jgi:hypothetical protein
MSFIMDVQEGPLSIIYCKLLEFFLKTLFFLFLYYVFLVSKHFIEHIESMDWNPSIFDGLDLFLPMRLLLVVFRLLPVPRLV